MSTYHEGPGEPSSDESDDSKSRRLSDEAVREYRERIFVGIGVGEPVTEAIRRAYENAWRQAREAGISGPLRVVEQRVDGFNPPNWCGIVLSA